MKKVGRIYIGSKHGLHKVGDDWAVVHACKTSHQQRLNYTGSIKGSPYYIIFPDGDHLYINWVDEPRGILFQVPTFIEALDFIDERIGDKNVFIHCDLGESRGPTLGMVYLAKRTDFLDDDFSKAFMEFSKHYPGYNPSGIARFVERNWDQIR